MTVSTEVDHNEYTGNGVTTSFPYTFRIFRKSDLVVQVSDLNGNVTELVLDTGYTVTGAGTYSGGSVVLPSPLATGWRITIDRVLDVVQETDLRNQGKFFPEVHEDAFDYLTMLIQQCFGWFRRALMKPSLLAKYYDAKQNRISNLADPSLEQDAVNNRSMRNYVDAAIAGVVGGFGWFIQYGSGAVYRTFQDKMRDAISPKDFGAVGDGINDDSTAISACLEASSPGYKIDGLGLTFKVSTLPDVSRFKNARFLFERIPGQPLFYASEDFIQGELFKITDTPWYNAWTQDKTFVYDNVIYAPFMAGDRHGVNNLHVAWVRSGDDGKTWTTPEWLTDLHENYPTVNYHCMSMGVVRNRLFAVIETRTVRGNKLQVAELWDR
ncbi:peptidase S74, partial [Escherichia coli]|nr:peptidase S74 [Escherichia coli]EJP0109680.1 peptidase S74 [Escherichia coli]EJP0487578.1 peptidase S74 [Escherichia coli]HDJ8071519.1 peptidase S74 [Escherichia coli]